MRIAISGAPGTGKTTLCNLIGQHTSLECLPEVEERVAVEMGYRDTGHLIKERGREGLLENFFLSLEKKVREERGMDNYVTDKTVWDVGARWFGRLWEGTTKEQHNRMREVMREFSQEKVYDKIIYLPLLKDRVVKDDGLRTTDFEIRYQRSLLIQGLLASYDVDFTPYDFKFSDLPEKVLKNLGLEKQRKD